jgi:hypothetical protein
MSQHDQHAGHTPGAGHGAHQNHYRRLLVMSLASFVAMYVLMYAMVDRLANVHPNFNQFYMAGLMTAAMIVIELAVMGGMYPDKRLNILLIVVSLVALAAFWLGIREQAAIDDRQFLKSMIPHHAGAILMCNEASIRDADVQTLCRSIVLGQQREIDQMTAKLHELEK